IIIVSFYDPNPITIRSTNRTTQTMAKSKKTDTPISAPRQGAASTRRAAKRAGATPSAGAGSLEKSLNVLEMVVSSSPAPSAAQITDALHLARPTTNRVISNLVKLDFLTR